MPCEVCVCVWKVYRGIRAIVNGRGRGGALATAFGVAPSGLRPGLKTSNHKKRKNRELSYRGRQ